MPNMQDWESLIAERTEAHGTVKTCIIEDASKRNRKNTSRIYENRPSTKEKRKAWAKSPAGKKSNHERNKRWRATEKGKIACRRKSSKYFHTHCNDPVWRAHRLEIQQSWKAHRRAKKILAQIPFENTLTLQDIGTITVHIYKGIAC
jgi:hypothetical protein